MANSATTVLPDPVGDPTNTLELVLYKEWKTIVCMGLKYLNLDEYIFSTSGLCNAVTGSGCKRNKSVLIVSFDGLIKCWNETACTVSEPIHRSDTTLTTTCAGNGSDNGIIKSIS